MSTCTRTHSRGMTLVEVLLALAIAALMILAGWRAIDTLQQSRDRVLTQAQGWQALDTFFSALEADLRRADYAGFKGQAEMLSFQLLPLSAAEPAQPVRYRLGQVGSIPILAREASGAPLEMMRAFSALRLSYSEDGQNWSAQTERYPLALRIEIEIAGLASPVQRLWVLR